MMCARCRKDPIDIPEYADHAKADNMEVHNWVQLEEGTFNHKLQLFVCTLCYIAIGMPSSPRGWKPEGLIE